MNDLHPLVSKPIVGKSQIEDLKLAAAKKYMEQSVARSMRL
jgi:hypothetical protein